MLRVYCYIVGFGFLVPLGSVAAATLTVPSPHLTIQNAINAAADGDTIEVAPGTHADPVTNLNKNVTIVGTDGAATTFITSGVHVTGTTVGVTLDGLTLSGSAGGGTVIVVDTRAATSVTDMTIKNCVFCGDNDPDRRAFQGGGKVAGAITFDNNEFKDFEHWLLTDNTNSGPTSEALLKVVFTNNYVHDCQGNVVFRGKDDGPVESDMIQTALVAGNRMVYTSLNGPNLAWAAIEVNMVLCLTIFDNTIIDHGPSNISPGEGQAIQCWSKTPWTLDINNNDLSGNHQGIAVAGNAGFYVPMGSISHNDLSLPSPAFTCPTPMHGAACGPSFGVSMDAFPPGDGGMVVVANPGNSLDAQGNYWGTADGPSPLGGSTATGTGAGVTPNVDFSAFLTAPPTPLGTSFAMRMDPVLGPAEIATAYLDVTSGHTGILSIGAQITYDPAIVSVAAVDVVLGADLPGSWTIAFLDVSNPGKVDVVVTDVTGAPESIPGPIVDFEAVEIELAQLDLVCFDPITVGFGSGGLPAAFPVDQFVQFASECFVVETSEATPNTPATGVFSNRDFIRGNVSVDRADHILDISDVVALAAFLFNNFSFGFDCDAASDTNNDGSRNITDLVTSVQGIFSTVIMAPPNFFNPGNGIPGVVVPNGGTIPSILGCSEGETTACP